MRISTHPEIPKIKYHPELATLYQKSRIVFITSLSDAQRQKQPQK